MAKSGELQEFLLGCLAEHDPHMHERKLPQFGEMHPKGKHGGPGTVPAPISQTGTLVTHGHG